MKSLYDRNDLFEYIDDKKNQKKHDIETMINKSKTKFINETINKINEKYTIKNVIRFILLNNKSYNIIKQILILNLIVLGIVAFALLPNFIITIKNFYNFPILLIHTIFVLSYYFLLTRYIYNSYFIHKLYKDDLKALFSDKEITLLEEILEFNKTPNLNEFKKEYFINLKNNKSTKY